MVCDRAINVWAYARNSLDVYAERCTSAPDMICVRAKIGLRVREGRCAWTLTVYGHAVGDVRGHQAWCTCARGVNFLGSGEINKVMVGRIMWAR